MSNPYETLNVSRNADDAAIKRAYHKLVMQYHPDKNPGDKTAEEKFKAVNNAYDILKDPQKRAAYDQFGDAAFAGGNGASAGAGYGGFNGGPFGGMGGQEFRFNMGGGFAGASMDDIIKQAMRGFGFGGEEEAVDTRGRDMLQEVMVTLREAYFGKTETIRFSSNVKCEKCDGNGTADGKPAPVCKTCRGSGYVHTRRGIFMSESVCPDCQGLGRKIGKKCSACDGTGVQSKTRTLEVKIPAGVRDGTRLRLAGQGETGMLGGESGDFYIDVRVAHDSVFSRIGDDLVMKINISFATLALGGESDITTIDGRKISVKIAAGTQIGERLRIRGAGMPSASTPLRRDASGDLYIDIATAVPKHLSRAQKKALEEFQKS